jgi:hypothetical protein
MTRVISRIAVILDDESHAGSATYPICGVYWAHPPKVDTSEIDLPPALRVENNDTLIDDKKCWDVHTSTLRSEGNNLRTNAVTIDPAPRKRRSPRMRRLRPYSA